MTYIVSYLWFLLFLIKLVFVYEFLSKVGGKGNKAEITFIYSGGSYVTLLRDTIL